MQQDISEYTSTQEPSQPLLFTIPQAAKSLGISRAMLYALLAKNEGPPVVRLGQQSVSRQRHCADGLRSKRVGNLRTCQILSPSI